MNKVFTACRLPVNLSSNKSHPRESPASKSNFPIDSFLPGSPSTLPQLYPPLSEKLLSHLVNSSSPFSTWPISSFPLSVSSTKGRGHFCSHQSKLCRTTNSLLYQVNLYCYINLRIVLNWVQIKNLSTVQ